MEISKDVRVYMNLLRDDRRYLHAHAELSGQEHGTTAFVKSVLGQLPGIETAPLSSETGVLALIRGGRPGRTLAFRADIDALPMEEESGLPFASLTSGVCHSCGHDLHTAILLGLARYLSDHREDLPGNIWLIFQPAEETLCGARQMIAEGCLARDPKPEAVFGLHCDPLFPAGRVGLISGSANASCDKVRLTVKSAGGHGAKSHLCCDTVLTMAELITVLHAAATHDNNYMLPATLTFGRINGGQADNVIPKEVVAEGTFRTFYPESRRTIRESIRRAAEGMAKTMNGEIRAEFPGEGVPSTYNDPVLFEEVRALLGDAFVPMALPSSGSEDFALYQERLPGLQVRLGTNSETDPATKLSLHNPGIHFEEGAMLFALELYRRIIYGNTKQGGKR